MGRKHDPMEKLMCPKCKKPMSLGSRVAHGKNACHCNHGDLDTVLKIASAPDIITPVSSATGIRPVGCFIMLVIIGLLAFAFAVAQNTGF